MREVTLAYGLNLLSLGLVEKLYSDGLDSDEYIYCKGRAYYYEDNCMIGASYFRTLTTLFELEWPLNHKFYVNRNGGISHNTFILEKDDNKFFFKFV